MPKDSGSIFRGIPLGFKWRQSLENVSGAVNRGFNSIVFSGAATTLDASGRGAAKGVDSAMAAVSSPYRSRLIPRQRPMKSSASLEPSALASRPRAIEEALKSQSGSAGLSKQRRASNLSPRRVATAAPKLALRLTLGHPLEEEASALFPTRTLAWLCSPCAARSYVLDRPKTSLEISFSALSFAKLEDKAPGLPG
ncbi:hypothetical protein KM043_012772 [Ampulex compressa]|nr:hypothetical protein KM043_012772 [Ampulex compressa]